MWYSLLNPWRSASVRPRPETARPRYLRPSLEQLEDRLVPSSFMAATVTDLIADINAANQAGGSNMITLTAPTTAAYNLTAVNNTADGATGLPAIAAKDTLTILGNGDTIQRNTALGTPSFRLFDVAGGASLTLANLRLQGGLAFGAGRSADGGAIYNQGSLDLIGVTVQNNIARGQNGTSGFHAGTPGQSAAAGGIYSSGSLTLEGGTSVQNNQALGGNGGTSWNFFVGSVGLPGGNGFGGGLYVASGRATLTDVTVSSNTAHGGAGGWAYAWWYRGRPGLGEGGGLYINTLATVYLDAFAVANVLNNTASTSDPNIHGSYNLLP